MSELILLRHGESLWNKENKFNGWTDVDLSPRGIEEVRLAARKIKQEKLVFDVAFTSVLKRAIRTLWIAQDDLDMMWIPVYFSWRLNERHYGALQGLNKSETAEKYGEEQVKIWRRSYDIRPPALEQNDPRYPGNDPRYKDLDQKDIPVTESLKDTVARFMPYWQKTILPALKKGKRVFVSAHGNSLRALVKHLDGISDEEIPQLNIPTGIPLVYELNKDLKPVRSYYLADAAELRDAQKAVEEQGRISGR